MTDDELGKNFFQYTNRGWSNPTPWERIPPTIQHLWIRRAKKALDDYNKEGEKTELS